MSIYFHKQRSLSNTSLQPTRYSYVPKERDLLIQECFCTWLGDTRFFVFWQGLDLNDHIFTKKISISTESVFPLIGQSDLLCCSPSFHQYLILYNIVISSPRRLEGFGQPMYLLVYRIRMYCCCRSDGACCYREDTSGSLSLVVCPLKGRQDWRFSDTPSRLSERVGTVVRALDTFADDSCLALDHRELRRGCRNMNMIILFKGFLDIFAFRCIFPRLSVLRVS